MYRGPAASGEGPRAGRRAALPQQPDAHRGPEVRPAPLLAGRQGEPLVHRYLSNASFLQTWRITWQHMVIIDTTNSA